MHETQAQIDRIRRCLALGERFVPWLALVAAPVGVFLVLRSQREAISAVDLTVSWQPVAVSALAFALGPLAQGLSFWLVLRLLTGETPLLDAMLVWSRSYVVRYAPTGALAIAYRLSARRRLHASTEQVLAAYAYEHIGALAAGAAACLVLFALAGDLPPLLPLGIALVALTLTAAVRPGIAGRAIQALAGRLGLHLSVVLPGRQLAAVVAVNALGWLGTGTAVYLLVAAVTESAPGFVWLVGSYTAGFLVGFVTPLAPGGLGAREGTLVVLLGPRYGTGAALGISLMIRLANVAGELLAIALAHGVYATWAVSRRHHRPRRYAGVRTCVFYM
jgi:glycosyltransferase 2 family protein